MANKIELQTLVNGPRNLVVQVHLHADGTGNLTNYPLIDMDDYTGNDSPTPTGWGIAGITVSPSAGMRVSIQRRSTTGTYRDVWEGSSNQPIDQSFDKVGGLNPPFPNPDSTLYISTVGFDTDGDSCTMLIKLRKKHKLDN